MKEKGKVAVVHLQPVLTLRFLLQAFHFGFLTFDCFVGSFYKDATIDEDILLIEDRKFSLEFVDTEEEKALYSLALLVIFVCFPEKLKAL